jgi:hypothetical protein
MCNAPDDRAEYLKQLDRELRHMIEQARQYPKGSSDYRKIVHRMTEKMARSGQILKSRSKEGADEYAEALLKTLTRFYEECCEFDPEKSTTVIRWFKTMVSGQLRNEKRDSRKPPKFTFKKQPPFSVRKIDSEVLRYEERSGEDVWNAERIEPDWNPWLSLPQDPMAEAERRELINTVRNCVQQCNRLRAKCVPNRPDIHCQMLLLRLLPAWDENSQLLIPGQSVEQLAQEFQVEKRQLEDCCNSYLRDKSCHTSLENCLESCRSLLF